MAPPALATTWYGAFLLEEDKVREHRLFPQEAAAIAERLEAIREGELLDEERELAEGLDEVLVPGRRLLSLGNATIGEVTEHATTPGEHGVDASLLQEALVLLARRTVRQGLADEATHMMQAISYLDESHEVENLLGERLVAWMTLHEPELVEACEDHAELARRLIETEDREDLRQGVEDPLGAPFHDREHEAALGLARAILEQVEARSPLESFIESVARSIAPNLCTLVGPTIAARLIHQAGGMDRLAKLPSSTIQTLGAEKALFRHFTEGAPPPKHGVIFQHPHIHRSHPNDRGSIARAMAAKAAIAARADHFGDKEIGKELKAELDRRVKEVKRVGKRRAMAKKGGR